MGRGGAGRSPGPGPGPRSCRRRCTCWASWSRQAGRTEAGDRAGSAERLPSTPPSSEYHSNLGGFYRLSGQCDQAIACFRFVSILPPGHAEAHVNLGLASDQQGRLDEAIAAYNLDIALRPDLAGDLEQPRCRAPGSGPARRGDRRVPPGDRARSPRIMPRPITTSVMRLKDQGRLDLAIAALHRAIAASARLCRGP